MMILRFVRILFPFLLISMNATSGVKKKKKIRHIATKVHSLKHLDLCCSCTIGCMEIWVPDVLAGRQKISTSGRKNFPCSDNHCYITLLLAGIGVPSQIIISDWHQSLPYGCLWKTPTLDVSTDALSSPQIPQKYSLSLLLAKEPWLHLSFPSFLFCQFATLCTPYHDFLEVSEHTTHPSTAVPGTALSRCLFSSSSFAFFFFFFFFLRGSKVQTCKNVTLHNFLISLFLSLERNGFFFWSQNVSRFNQNSGILTTKLQITSVFLVRAGAIPHNDRMSPRLDYQLFLLQQKSHGKRKCTITEFLHPKRVWNKLWHENQGICCLVLCEGGGTPVGSMPTVHYSGG